MLVHLDLRFKACLAALLLCMLLGPAAWADPLTPQAGLEALQNGDIVILDVRNPDELKNGFYPGSLNIPMSELEKRLSEVPHGATVLIHCARGVRAKKAEEIIKPLRPDLKILYIAGKPIFKP